MNKFFSSRKGIIILVLLILIALFTLMKFIPITINSIEVKFNGDAIKEYTFEYGTENDITISILINDNALLGIKKVDLKWEFLGNDLGLSVCKNKLITRDCETIGKTILKLSVSSKNTIEKEIEINIIQKKNSVLTAIECLGLSEENKTFIEGQLVDTKDYIIKATFGNYSAKILDFKIFQEKYSTENNNVQIEYSYNGVEKILIVPVTIKAKTLQEIIILNEPNKTIYIEGQNFDSTGLKVLAKYEYVQNEIIEFYYDTKPLTINDTFVTIYYTESNIEGSVTKTITQEIKVNHRTLQSISTNTSKVKLEYVQGETFNKTNLVVKALFDIGEYEITEYNIDTEKVLTHEDTEITVSYTENNITKTSIIPIVVNEPYSKFRNVIFSDSPTSVRLNWQYSYMNSLGESCIDNTTFLEHKLVFDEKNGIYQIPVGAIVTIEALDNSIIDFYFNGVAQGLTYPSKTLTFKLENNLEDLNITLKKINGTISLIFKNDINTLSLTYYQNWNGIIKDEDLDKIVFAFEENNQNYYNIFIVDDIKYSFKELKQHKFESSTMIIVERRKIVSDSTITLILREDYQIKITVDKSDQYWKENIPKPSRIGYNFIEFEEIETDVFKAKWQLIEVTYKGDFIGNWNYSIKDGENLGCCQIILKTNGTYIYKSWLNNELNLNFTGIYSYDAENSKLELLSVELNSEIVSIKPQDIDLTYEYGKLLANLIVIDDENDLQTIESVFEKDK